MTDDKLREFSEDHVYYETEMLFEVSAMLRTERFQSPDLPDVVFRNALVESFAIHVRSLTNFLYDQAMRRDDVVAEHYVADVEEWRAARGEIPEVLRVARERTGKEIAHLTTRRHASGTPEKRWTPAELTKALVVPLKKFVATVPQERLDFGIRFFVEALNG